MAHAHTWDEFEPVGMRYRILDKVALEDGRGLAAKDPLPEVLTPRCSKRMHVNPGHIMTPVGELSYFGVRGRAEPLRFILHYSGLAYTNRIVAGSEWGDMKAATPRGQLPIFLPEDEEEPICGTLEIAKFIAELSKVPGLMPTDTAASESAGKMFEVAMAEKVHEAFKALNILPAVEVEGKLSAIVAAAVKEIVPFSKQLTEGSYFGGAAPHYGDFALFYAVDILRVHDANVFETLGGSWKSWFDAMSKLSGIEAYLKSRPKANGGEVGFPGSRIATLPLDD
uniref:GST N-terminal domain-containing protein n=1 Tax=Haptolina brevifila TaxID=156173 RepID=A0A7S2CDJ7_9EUKA|eukprot:CAMPEP_0174721168 /NCGR_PEP_ID=MMETSP1094-20130205/35464_1 /TAXON_ID=156173 /ORGANISM="Chrysochromulina brevifilum, Strain UTEX LB 985" /LENGTH=281 /DNA_ID=CAMNT_0015921803 /DNA_START=81 /DNA_END=926 /DNA_ORIENTATION=+